jgi:hypothetical protein
VASTQPAKSRYPLDLARLLSPAWVFLAKGASAMSGAAVAKAALAGFGVRARRDRDIRDVHGGSSLGEISVGWLAWCKGMTLPSLRSRPTGTGARISGRCSRPMRRLGIFSAV